ncbi:MAG: ATP synthase F1 subunit epsilon [Acidimicrobiaceae bacterium]|nr:ATP synthase F1 subunit epsilon [Acidimicrobiaceae bacterium]MDE0495671.1 ATP synthase F1 subunit epsilon [Acidimicrobiaceae bacterium]MDE0665236.1 ATP synthase F1 subunit epsilon [Acidimicrobiaceae bacterium]MXY11627.1 ATP synthase F1 subunit epsilon [Acidimicrobiaceae bacterium]MXZ64433.1 ATP synthase F1 subunit epsilon [Acidimicrobiaceae bacterium]
MAVELDVALVSPEEVTYSGSAEMVIVRTVEEGDIAFQAGHVPFLGVLAPWSVDVLRPGGERDTFAVHRGFVEVSHNKVTILSDVSEPAAEIDVARAESARQRASEALASDSDDAQAGAALERANLRLRVATSA